MMEEAHISSNSTLDIGDQVLATKAIFLENKVKDLESALKRIKSERDDLSKKLRETVVQKEQVFKRLESITLAHESKVTELHCVIAELSKKIQFMKTNSIAEEGTECAESEIEYNEESVCCYSEPNNPSNPDDSDFLVQKYSNVVSVINRNNEEVPPRFNEEELHEEILGLKAHIALLESQIANKGESQPSNFYLSKTKSTCTESFDFVENKDILRSTSTRVQSGGGDDVGSLSDNEGYQSRYTSRPSSGKLIKTSSNISNVSNENQNQNWKSTTKETFKTKVAERVKLRRTLEDNYITGSELVNSDIKNTEIVEHLLSDMMKSQEFMSPTDSISVHQLHTEIEKLRRKIDHLKLKNNVFGMTLEESKEHCEYLYLLCGRYESNAVALQLALNYSDRAIEAYDVMLALLESKIAMQNENSNSAKESRKAVEAVARHLLDRLESEKSFNQCSLGPWQTSICINQPTKLWSQEDDDRLRGHVSKLKGRRAETQNTVVTLESPFASFCEKSRKLLGKTRNQQQQQQMDLEMAVVMQELLTLRDDFAAAKQKLFLAEKENKMNVNSIRFVMDTLSQIETQLYDSDFLYKERSVKSIAENFEQSTSLERQLLESKTRESDAKNHIQRLIQSVSMLKCETVPNSGSAMPQTSKISSDQQRQQQNPSPSSKRNTFAELSEKVPPPSSLLYSKINEEEFLDGQPQIFKQQKHKKTMPKFIPETTL